MNEIENKINYCLKKAVLIGTRHSIQRGTKKNDNFKDFIKELCTKYKIKAIAEEIDNENKYIAQNVSTEFGIKYKIIEPTPEEKKKLQIEEEYHIIYELSNRYDIEDWDKQYTNDALPPKVLEEYKERLKKTYKQREKVWMKKILQLNTWPLLIICGSDHSQSFCELLTSLSIDVIKKDEYKETYD